MASGVPQECGFFAIGRIRAFVGAGAPARVYRGRPVRARTVEQKARIVAES
jgi:hypothetical protein